MPNHLHSLPPLSEGFLSPHLVWLFKQIPSSLMATFNHASGQNTGTACCITCAHAHTELFSSLNHHISAKVCSELSFCTLGASLALHFWHFPSQPTVLAQKLLKSHLCVHSDYLLYTCKGYMQRVKNCEIPCQMMLQMLKIYLI